MTLKYYREAKVFLSKASKIVQNALNLKKIDLQEAIMRDLTQLGRVMRSMPKAD